MHDLLAQSGLGSAYSLMDICSLQTALANNHVITASV